MLQNKVDEVLDSRALEAAALERSENREIPKTPSSTAAGFNIGSVWQNALSLLQRSLDAQIFAAWIAQLSIQHYELAVSDDNLRRALVLDLGAPNKFCCDHVKRTYGQQISAALAQAAEVQIVEVSYRVVNDVATITTRNISQGRVSSAGQSTNGLSRIGGLKIQIPAARQAESGQNDSQAGTGHSASNGAGFNGAVSNGAVSNGAVSNGAVSNGAVSNGTVSNGTASNGAALNGAAHSLARKTVRKPAFDFCNLNSKYNFSNFVIGQCNQFAHAASLRVAENPGGSYNPLFIYGGVGLGKTHLVNAIGNAARRRGKNVLLVSSEVFVNELISSLRSNRMQQFKEKFRSLDLLVIDDIQFIIGKERTQEEFFHTFNALYQRRSQIVITSDKVPQELTGLEERLRTRFACGLSADLQAPDFETRVAILQKKSESEQISLPDDVAQFLAEKIDTNVRELEGALNRLNAVSAINRIPITLELAEGALRTLVPDKTREITIELIQKTVAERYNTSVKDLIGKRRTQNIALPRQVAMHLARRLTTCSYPEIGSLFGGRDHSTVIHANRVIVERLKSDSQLIEDLEVLERRLRGR